MSESIKYQLNSILTDLNSINDIEASAVVSRDGLLISANTSNGLDADTFAAMMATMMGAAETALFELDKGDISQVIVESNKAKMVCVGAGERALLILMVLPDTQIEQIRNSLYTTKDKIISLLNKY